MRQVASMRRRFAVCLLAAAMVAAGCSEAADPSGQVTVSRDGGSVVLTSSAQGRSDVNTQFMPKGTPPAVHFSSFEWPAQSVSDLYVYGLAPAGAASVETVPAGSARSWPRATARRTRAPRLRSCLRADGHPRSGSPLSGSSCLPWDRLRGFPKP
jgi:hypothetical protein